MKMTRRFFLKGAGTAAAVVVLPSLDRAPIAETPQVAQPKVLPPKMDSFSGPWVASGGFCAPMTPYYEIVDGDRSPSRGQIRLRGEKSC